MTKVGGGRVWWEEGWGNPGGKASDSVARAKRLAHPQVGGKSWNRLSRRDRRHSRRLGCDGFLGLISVSHDSEVLGKCVRLGRRK